MSNNSTPKAIRRNYILLLASIICIILFSFVVAPIFVGLNSNTIYENSIIASVLYYLSHLLEYAYIALIFGFVVCGEYLSAKYSISGKRWLIIGIAAVVFKHLSNLVFSLIIDGGSFWYMDIASIVLYAAIDACVIIIAKFASKSAVKAHFDNLIRIRKAMRQLDMTEDETNGAICPFGAFISFKHPILAPLAIATIAFAATGLIQQLVLLPVLLDTPESLLAVFQSFIMNILFSALGYVIAYLGCRIVLSNDE